MVQRPNLPNRAHRRNLYLVVFAVASLSIFFFVCTRVIRARNAHLYSIVIDAGSTGTRLHVYAYTPSPVAGGLPVLDLERTAVMRSTPGLSAFEREPALAGAELEKLLEFAKGKVDERQWGETEVRLMATAGLRLMEPESREKVLEECRKVLQASRLRFEYSWASVIPGSDEGLYAWVAANFALGSLGGDPAKTIGIIELGGASTQLTFASNEALPPESKYALAFGQSTFNLYSHSFLHFGQNAAQESLHELLRSSSANSSAETSKEVIVVDPCVPKGYWKSLALNASDFHSTMLGDDLVLKADGNFTACRSFSQVLLQQGKDDCPNKSCGLGSFVPDLRGQFLATENFYFTTKFFGLSNASSLSELIFAGEQFCKEDWLKLRNKYGAARDIDISHYCFSAAYIVALLHDSLNIPLDDTGRILYSNQIGDIQVEWALGAFITSVTSRDASGRQKTALFSASVHNNSLLVFLLLSALLVVGAWLVARWRKPHMKTIYDLEKGRYVVTRIS